MNKILVVTSTFPRWKNDTIPDFVYELCRYLYKRGFEIDVLAPHTENASTCENIEGLNIFRYRYSASKFQKLAYNGGILANLKRNPLNYLLVPFFIIFQITAVYKLVKKNQYSLLHAHWVIPQGFACALVKKISRQHKLKVLCTAHGSDYFLLNKMMFKGLKKWIYRNIDYLAVVSEAMQKDIIKEHIINGNIGVLPMGVDLKNTFYPRSNIKRSSLHLIHVGRLVEGKGTEYLIDALGLVKQKYNDIKLTIVGDGPLKQALESRTHRLGLTNNIHFHGYEKKENLPDLYSSASIAVFPSEREGLGLVIIEAMGCECAIIASDIPSVRDIVDDKSGMLVEAGNTDFIAEKILQLLDNNLFREQLAVSGRNSVLTKFDCRSTSDKYYNLITRLSDTV